MIRITTSTPDKEPKPEPTKEAPRPKRRWLARLVASLLVIACFCTGWFSYKVAAATNRIFTENTTGGSDLLSGKKLPDSDLQRINILLIGIGGGSHDGPNLADTIQVASIDPKHKQIAMLSLPRDLYVQVPQSTSKVKINEVHVYGEEQDSKGGGPGLLKETVQNIIDQPIHYFVRVDFDGFQDMVNSVGGVDITVKEQLYDPNYPRGESAGYEILNVKPGVQHMDGALALKYARSRETTTDFDRSRRQQEVMVAVREKALSLEYLSNPSKISQALEIAGNHVKTDLSPSELQKLAKLVKDIPTTGINSKVLDNSNVLYDSVGPGGAYILVPRSGNFSDVRAFVDQFFNSTAIAGETARIEILNGNGRSGLAQAELDALSSFGYNIAGAGSAPPAQTTVIYDYTNGRKPATIAGLEKRYKVKAVKQSRAAGDTVDIRVIIGSDYPAVR